MQTSGLARILERISSGRAGLYATIGAECFLRNAGTGGRGAADGAAEAE